MITTRSKENPGKLTFITGGAGPRYDRTSGRIVFKPGSKIIGLGKIVEAYPEVLAQEISARQLPQ